MAASIVPEYPPDLTPEQEQYLLTSLNDWSIANGLAVRPSPAFVPSEQDPAGVLAVTAPVTLFPSPFPKACFEEARAIQTAYNELYAAIARDEEWLGEVIQELIEVDDFIAKLWDVHLAVKKEGYVQDLSLGLFRSDYMIHVDPSTPDAAPELRQVEFNTIASSFGGLSSQVSLLHKHLLATTAYPPHPSLTPSALPHNPSISGLSHGLATAHHAYGPSVSTPPLPTCILIIVQTPERNVFDQRHLEYALTTHHHIPVFRLPFAHVLTQTHTPPTNPLRPLTYTPPHSPSTPYEVSTLYLRAAYTPAEHVSFPTAWRARYHLERSRAIKCPSILTHLAGSKKVQQVLATPIASSSSSSSSPTLSPQSRQQDHQQQQQQQQQDHLTRFIHHPPTVARLRATFAAIYPLDTSAPGLTAKAIATSPAQCTAYVLKPQREGGGNNIYRGAIPGFLNGLRDAGNDDDSEEGTGDGGPQDGAGPDAERKWRGYVLMEMIEPPARRNVLVREGVVKTGDVIGELGVYGTVLWRAAGWGGAGAGGLGTAARSGGDGDGGGAVVLLNREAGYLLRTKGRESEEGGVAAGFGAVDSVLLVE